jgi:hypothetical protein
MLVMTTVGQTVFDPRDEAFELIAVGGFVAPSVRAILAVHDGHERTIGLSSPVGAFVVVAVGSGSVTLTPLGADGTPLGRGRRFE